MRHSSLRVVCGFVFKCSYDSHWNNADYKDC